MINKEIKKQIDDMSYESLLSLWRHAPSGHPMFQNEIGDYYSEVMKRKRKKVGNAKHIQASKNIGWN